MRWQYKCVIDTCKALIPMQNQLRALRHNLFGYEPDSPGVIAGTVKDGLQQVQWVRSVRPLSSAKVLEIGSGWQPLIPILFSLAGAERVYLTDQHRLLGPITLRTALKTLRPHADLIIKSVGIAPDAFERAMAVPEDFNEAMEFLRLTYLAPCDCRRLSLDSGSVDVIISRAALEHIPQPVLRDIFDESYRLLSDGGVVCHFVDNSDHWEHRDKAISRVNFLRYPDAVFRWTCLHPQNFQNRLRHPQYVEMLKASGVKLLRDEVEVDGKSLAALKALPVTSRFSEFAATDLATISSYLMAEKIVKSDTSVGPG